ncbi:hypothetical protein Tco_1571026 [Tanacetum coccineum]
MQAKIFKENSLNKLNALKSTTQLLERQTFSGCILYQQAFAQLFGDSVRTFKFQLSQHMNNLETLLNAETLHEMDSKSALSVIKVQFERFINSDLLKPLDIYSRSFSSDREVRENFRDYTKMTAQTFKETIIQNMNSIEQCIIERASHEQELKMTLKKLSERQLQIQQCKFHDFNHRFTNSGDETSSRIVSDEEIDKQELEAHYGFMAKIQEVLPAESKCADERAALANLIANLTLDTEENKTILKQLKKANASLTQELEKCKTNLDETNSALGEAISCRDSCLIALQNKHNEFEKYKAFRPWNDWIINVFKQKLTKLNAFPNPTAKSMEVLIKTLLMPLSNKTILDSHCFVHELKREMHDDLEYVKSLEKEIDELESEKADFSNIYDLLLEEFKECECLALKLSKQTESVNNEVHNKLLKSFAKLEKHSISLELSLQHCKEQMKNNPVCKENASNVFRKEREQYHEIQDLKAQMQDKNMVINIKKTHSRVNHTTSVSRPQLKCYQVKDKVVPNNSQVKFQKKEVEDHHRISSISKKTKSVTACNDSSKHQYLKDVNARTKKPNVVPISASKPKRKANKSVATPHKKTVASDTTIQKSKSYYKELYENTNQEWKWWIAKRCPSGYTWTQKPLRTKKIWMPKIRKDDESTSISPTIDIVSRITNIVQLILFIVDSGCTKHMTAIQAFMTLNNAFQASSSSNDFYQNRIRLRNSIDHYSNEQSSFKVGSKSCPPIIKDSYSRQELELLFHHHIAMLRTTEHSSDTNEFTMKMEILLEPASNKLLVGDLRDSI